MARSGCYISGYCFRIYNKKLDIFFNLDVYVIAKYIQYIDPCSYLKYITCNRMLRQINNNMLFHNVLLSIYIIH
jgi:hypothetical protein